MIGLDDGAEGDDENDEVFHEGDAAAITSLEELIEGARRASIIDAQVFPDNIIFILLQEARGAVISRLEGP